MRIVTALSAFFKTLFNRQVADEISHVLQNSKFAGQEQKIPSTETETTPAPKPQPSAKASRNDAVTLLATLQREARFIDFIQENLDDYTNDQVGAAVRDIHRDCYQVLDRLFGIQEVVTGEEGESISLPKNYQLDRFQLVGNISEEVQSEGKLIHHGWEISKCEIPTWSGNQEASTIIAPAEVEV